MPGHQINRDSATPPYRQVARFLIEDIKAGKFTADDGEGRKLPAVPVLMHEYGIALETARKTLRTVREAGWASFTNGMGYYAVPGGPEGERGHGGGTS